MTDPLYALAPGPRLTPDLYEPPDVDEQHELWGANCGPAALAAILGRTVAEVRPLIQPFKGYMHAGDLEHALMCVPRVSVRRQNFTVIHGRGSRSRPWPTHGLAVIQIDGPWCDLKNPRAAYKYTHTVAVDRRGAFPRVYDGNATMWLHEADWQREIMDEIVRTKRATGWWIRTSLEVRP